MRRLAGTLAPILTPGEHLPVIWVVLAAVAVPLWLCGWAILTVVIRNRGLRTRPGSLPVRIRRPGEARWVRGYGVWIHDVFAFRGSPAAWKEELIRVSELSLRVPFPDERYRWRQLGDDPVVAALRPAEAADATVEVVARGEHRDLLSGPFLTLGAELKGHPSG
jgi:hypothetical protein